MLREKGGFRPTQARLLFAGGGSWISAGLLLVFVGVALLGCAPVIEVTQPGTPPALATAAPEAHALAIVGVDFDPPLEYAQVVANGGVTLLVAIENRGLSDEVGLVLTARLSDGAAAVGQPELLDERIRLEILRAGEVRVVRFPAVTQLPQREQYELLVTLSPVPAERDLLDNQRTFVITVRTGQ